MKTRFKRSVWLWLLGLCCGAAMPLNAAAAASGKLLLMGQSNKAAWENFDRYGSEPNGGSVYYELRSASWVSGIGGVPLHQQYADFVTGKPGKYLQVGMSWKDNPPGWDGNEDHHQEASRTATQALANGLYLSNFDPLIDYLNAHPGTTFMLRVDYEVSSAFHCTDASCSSYKDAYNRIAGYFRGKLRQNNAAFVYHPVRGEYATLYPGDANVDWIGLSVFNHELCMPIWDVNQALYNGTPGVGYDTRTNQCLGYILVRGPDGNVNAQPAAFDYDLNVLGMLKFAKDHGKRLVYSESAPMNFVAGQNANGTDSDALAATWAKRYFALMDYVGPMPNQLDTVDLRGVVQAAVYMNLDLRYGWDGYYGQPNFVFPYDSMWFNQVELDQYTSYKTAFCDGLASHAFLATCDGGGGGDQVPPSKPRKLKATAVTAHSITLKWKAADDNVGVTRYDIYRDGSFAGSSATPRFVSTGLAPNTTYRHRVKACDAAGNCSGLSDTERATTLPAE